MKTSNPLPGMNPYLEIRWPDAHLAIIGFIRDLLNQRLPQDLSAIAEEAVSIDSPAQLPLSLRADIAVAENVGFESMDSRIGLTHSTLPR